MKKISKKLLSVLLLIAMIVPTGALMMNTSAATVSIPDDAVEFNGHYYKTFEDGKTWKQARVYCDSLGGHLVTITSQAENDFIFSLIADSKSLKYSIGFTDKDTEGDWKWITNEVVDFTNWGSIQPDNATKYSNSDGQDYATIVTKDDLGSSDCIASEWDDVADVTNGSTTDYLKSFICEWESVEQTITGKMTGSSNAPQIAIDGTWYEYDTSVPGLAEAIEKFALNNTITCKIRFGKIVACSKKEVTNNVALSIKASDSTIEYDSRTNTYSPESITLSLTVANNVKYSNGGVVDTAYLAGYDITFDKLVFDVKNGDMLYFKDGFLDWGSTQELEKEFKTPVALKAGETFSFNDDLTAYVKDDYKWSDTEQKKDVQIVVRAYNGDTVVASESMYVSFKNQNVEILSANVTDLHAKIEKAAKNLKQTSGVMTDAYLEKLLTKDGLQEATNALKCKVALSSTVLKVNKESTFEDKLIEKLMKKAGISKEWMGAAYTTDISYSVPAETKENGKFVVKFNIELTNINIGNNNPYAGFSFDTTYEIKGGKNIEQRTGSVLSWFGYANIETFADSVTEVALEQVEYAYNLGYGEDFDEVCEMFFDDTITSILSKTKAESYSHVFYEAMTYPSKKVNVHCPVDVYVYNTEGTLCASVENNKITMTCSDIDIEVIGDEKYFTIYGGDYSIEIIATAIGDMDIEIEEYSSKDRLLRSTDFNNIVITPGDSFKTDMVEDYFYTDYNIIKNKEEVILADSEESSIHYADLVEIRDKEATCTEDGEYHVECAKCKETILKGMIHATGHSDTNHNGICDSCGHDFTINCGHTCHSDNAFVQFFYKIARFFWKLFGMQNKRFCACGKAHW